MNSQPSEIQEEFISLPFWRWDLSRADHRQLAIDKNKRCCFNHLIGLPRKDARRMPIFAWQKDIFEAYENHKYAWILKATGLGVTEFTLRYILWKCTHSNEWSHSWVPIVTGPRIDMTRESITRMKDMIMDSYPIRDVTREDFTINNVRVHAFPSNHLDTFRSLPSVKFVFLDEADFFAKEEQYQVRTISERYIAKSDTRILMVSTPNRPGGLMERIQEEADSMYHKITLPYTVGLGTMYSEEQIRENMKSPSFQQEYNLKYLGEVGNIFNLMDIEYCIKELGQQYDPDDEATNTFQMTSRFMGVDPGFGSSMFGIVLTQMRDGLPEVIYADHIERGSMTECLNVVLKMAQKYRVMKIYIDGSSAGFVKDLKIRYNEPDATSYAQILEKHPEAAEAWIHTEKPRVVPISFRKKHREMLMNLEQFIQKRLIRIHPSHTKLAIALRTATSKDEQWNLDKEKTSHDDILDSLMLSLLGFYLT